MNSPDSVRRDLVSSLWQMVAQIPCSQHTVGLVRSPCVSLSCTQDGETNLYVVGPISVQHLVQLICFLLLITTAVPLWKYGNNIFNLMR